MLTCFLTCYPIGTTRKAFLSITLMFAINSLHELFCSTYLNKSMCYAYFNEYMMVLFLSFVM